MDCQFDWTSEEIVEVSIEDLEKQFEEFREKRGIQGRRYDIGCPTPWIPLVLELEAKISGLAPEYSILQVKEKFGGLRFYSASGQEDKEVNEKIYALIGQAEAKSYKICQFCGKDALPEEENTFTSWYYTCCPDCLAYLNEHKRYAGIDDGRTTVACRIGRNV